MSAENILAVVAVMALVTFGLRVLPFIFTRLFKENRLLKYMGENMPVGIMTMLAIYATKDIDLFSTTRGYTTLACMALAIVLYWSTNNALIAIIASLGCYLAFVNFV